MRVDMSMSLDGLAADVPIFVLTHRPPEWLLNGGTRLFVDPGSDPVELERVRTVESVGMTHLRFRVR